MMKNYAEEMMMATINTPVEYEYTGLSNETDKQRKEKQVDMMIALTELKYDILFSGSDKATLKSLIFTISKRSKKELLEETGAKKVLDVLENIEKEQNIKFDNNIKKGFAYCASCKLTSEEMHKLSRFLKIYKLLSNISQKYGCEFPEKFASQLYKSASNHEKYPSMQTVEGIRAEWEIYWANFAEDSEFTKFMMHKLEKIMMCQCSVTYSFYNGDCTKKAYIGTIVNLKRIPEERMCIILSISGQVRNETKTVFKPYSRYGFA